MNFNSIGVLVLSHLFNHSLKYRIEDLLVRADSKMSKEDMMQFILSFGKQLKQILDNQEIKADSDKFDSKIQQAIDRVNTDKTDEDQLIDKMEKKGYIYNQ